MTDGHQVGRVRDYQVIVPGLGSTVERWRLWAALGFVEPRS